MEEDRGVNKNLEGAFAEEGLGEGQTLPEVAPTDILGHAGRNRINGVTEITPETIVTMTMGQLTTMVNAAVEAVLRQRGNNMVPPLPPQGSRDEFASHVRENMQPPPPKEGMNDGNGRRRIVKSQQDMAEDESQTSRTDRGVHSKAHSDLSKRIKELGREIR